MRQSPLFSPTSPAPAAQAAHVCASPAESASSSAGRPDTLAWATWLRWGRMGDRRSLQLLRQDLVRRGVWGVAHTEGAGWQTQGTDAGALAGWTPYERALAAAAVVLVCRAVGGSPAQRTWAPLALAAAVRRAEQAPQEHTPDGAPMLLACRLVLSASLLDGAAPAAGHAEGWHNLAAVLADAGFNSLPLPWRQAAWRVAEAHHRTQGDPVLARHYLALLAGDGQSAVALMARLQLGSQAGAPLLGF